jgi:hypothetical protein
VVHENGAEGEGESGWDAGQEQQRSASATTAWIEGSSEQRRDGEEERRKIHSARNELRCKHGKPPPVSMASKERTMPLRVQAFRSTMEISVGARCTQAVGGEAPGPGGTQEAGGDG